MRQVPLEELAAWAASNDFTGRLAEHRFRTPLQIEPCASARAAS
jgi:hypothetical protein